MSQWDSNFTPLLESHDPGESEQKGGLLVAHYGKGLISTQEYAFFPTTADGRAGGGAVVCEIWSAVVRDSRTVVGRQSLVVRGWVCKRGIADTQKVVADD